jgi:dUTP pyrophosphatase
MSLLRKLSQLLFNNSVIEYVKTRNVKSPGYGSSDAVGIDFYIPDSSPVIIIPPHGDAKIPSGIKVKLPKKTALISFNKSGISTNKKLVIGAQVVDPDYQGEVHIHLLNTSGKEQVFNPGDKATQFIHLPIYKAKMILRSSAEEMYEGKKTDRGEGGFGSTDNKDNVDKKKKKYNKFFLPWY